MREEEEQIEIKKGYTPPEPPEEPIEEAYVPPDLPEVPQEEPPREPPGKK